MLQRNLHRKASVASAAAIGSAVGLGWWMSESLAKPKEIPLTAFRDPPEGRTWVSLHGSVYDVTEFLEAHPGGAGRIQMVNGQDLSAYWHVYHEIHDRPHIRELLEDYKIGSLSPIDAEIVEKESYFDDAYLKDPKRPREKEMRVPSTRPWNHEPPLHMLTESFLTPNDVFFVRNHNAVPEIDADEWRLEIEPCDAAGITGTSFSLHDLRTRFPRHQVIATIQCAGNRQEDFVTPTRPLYVAPHWRGGAIGCARWVGVRVRDIFRAAGLDVDGMALGTRVYPGVRVANFVAEDTDETGTPYAGVLPIEKIVDPFGDAILAYEMNDEPLPADHGFPVRLLAPGHAGCRNVKWVSRICLAAAPSELDSGSKLDRHFAPDVEFKAHIRRGDEHLRLDQGPVIQTLPVQSIISRPPNRATLSGRETDHVTVEGIAWSGGGRGVCRVEVSIDGGQTFKAAELFQRGIPRTPDEWKRVRCPKGRGRNATNACAMQSTPQSGMGRHWAWQQFQSRVPLPEQIKRQLRRGESVELSIVANAIDGDFNSQPEFMDSTWNVLGICCNHRPQVSVTLDPSKSPEAPIEVPQLPPAGSCVWPVDHPGYQYRVSDEKACGPKGYKSPFRG